MLKKKKFGQFYTKNSDYIVGNLLNDLPKELNIIEPFCGQGDLVFKDRKYELYDIDPKIQGCVQQDTLLNPPDYQGKLVITNPPFLNKNKSLDKIIYEKYSVDDLYKAAIKTLIDCEGGILILPLNFLSDEDNEIRDLFFSNYKIINLNIFEEKVFSDTTYIVCSFSFQKKKKETISDILNICFFPSMEKKEFKIEKKYGWKIGGEFLSLINNQVNIGITRVQIGQISNSQLYLRAIDSGSENGKIELMISDKVFYGKKTDRTFASINLDREYSLEEQQKICLKFNSILNENRIKYNSLFLTNFRNASKTYSRKRISFDFAYKLISYIIKN